MKKRVNHTDPVDQVRLRVMIGNFHGAIYMVRLAAGSVFLGSRRNDKQEPHHDRTNFSRGAPRPTANPACQRRCHRQYCTGGRNLITQWLLGLFENQELARDYLVGAEIQQLISSNIFQFDAFKAERLNVSCEG